MNHFANRTSSFLIFRRYFVILFYFDVIELLRFNLLCYECSEEWCIYPSPTVIVSCSCFAIEADNLTRVLHQIGILSGKRALEDWAKKWTREICPHANFHLIQPSEGHCWRGNPGLMCRRRLGKTTWQGHVCSGLVLFQLSAIRRRQLTTAHGEEQV